jgi:hypothetical protein
MNTAAQDTAYSKRLLIGGTRLEITLKKKLRRSPDISKTPFGSAREWETPIRESHSKRVRLLVPTSAFMHSFPECCCYLWIFL